MVEPTHLSKAPIKEALIDIQVTQDSRFDIKSLDLDTVILSEIYSKKEKIKTHLLAFKINLETDQSNQFDKTEIIGYKYTSADGTHVAQFRRNGLTYSKLEPYQNWDATKSEAKRLWDIYLKYTAPTKVNRIAVRYINMMNLPLDQPLSDFLTIPPNIPSALNQSVNSFLTRIVTQDSSSETQCVFNHVLENTGGRYVSTTLDIDVFVQKEFGINDPFIWGQLDQLRKFKNKVFFDCITKKTEGLYK